jgi:hypothetical protein
MENLYWIGRMLCLFVVEMVFQYRLRSTDDQDSCEWPLFPDGLGHRTKNFRPEMIAENTKGNCLGPTKREDLTLTKGRRNKVVGASQ